MRGMRSSAHYRILSQREHQPAYRTAFYGCVGCSAMFTDRYKFCGFDEKAVKQYALTAAKPWTVMR